MRDVGTAMNVPISFQRNVFTPLSLVDLYRNTGLGIKIFNTLGMVVNTVPGYKTVTVDQETSERIEAIRNASWAKPTRKAVVEQAVREKHEEIVKGDGVDAG